MLQFFDSSREREQDKKSNFLKSKIRYSINKDKDI